MQMDESWLEKLLNEFSKNYMQELKVFLREEKKARQTIYPKEEEIFNAFCLTSFEEVKVVIVGQDPYHGENQAHGLSFSVPLEVEIPPSLKNIYKEIIDDVGIKMPTTGCLVPWAKQGVLLLNATLTVRAHLPKSHYGKGWETFTDHVVELLSLKEDPIVFLLWGSSAQEKVERVFDKKLNSNHLILKASHPSFYSAGRGFFGCRHFSKTNEFLKKIGKKTIDWQIP